MELVKLQEIFAERLKDLMAEYKIKSIKELSKKVNIPRTTISNWINKVRNPQIDSLVLLADFFNVSTDYLLGRTADYLQV